MQISINNELKEVSSQLNIESLLEEISLPSTTGIAVAVNNQVVKKSAWGKFCLSENDEIIIIKAVQGG